MMICMKYPFLSKRMIDKCSKTNTKQANHIIQQQQQFSFSVVSLFSVDSNGSVIILFAPGSSLDGAFWTGSGNDF